MLFHYYSQREKRGGVMAARYKNYKAHFFTEGNALSDDYNYDAACRSSAGFQKRDPPLLFDLDLDPGERYPIPVDDPRYFNVRRSLNNLSCDGIHVTVM